MTQAPAKMNMQGVPYSEIKSWGGLFGGLTLIVYGLLRRSWGGLVLALLGAGIFFQMLKDYQQRLSPEKSKRSFKVPVPRSAKRGFVVTHSEIINRPPADLYNFWLNFENLPKFMRHLVAVWGQNERRSHWVAKAPAGMTVEWDAEITRKVENELIAWRSLEGADVENTGQVQFERLPENRGTRVKVTLRYQPPGGQVGAAFAKLFGEAPEQQIAEDMRRFKQLMETGEIPSTAGQPAGPKQLSFLENLQRALWAFFPGMRKHTPTRRAQPSPVAPPTPTPAKPAQGTEEAVGL